MKLTLRTTTGIKPGLVEHLASQLYYFSLGIETPIKKKKKMKKMRIPPA
jgi:hypothetical protein